LPRRAATVRFAKTSRVLFRSGTAADDARGCRATASAITTKPTGAILDDFACVKHTEMHADDLYEMISTAPSNGSRIL